MLRGGVVVALRERARPRRREAIDVVDIAANGTILAALAVHKTYKTEAGSVEALRAVDPNVRRGELLDVEEGCP